MNREKEKVVGSTIAVVVVGMVPTSLGAIYTMQTTDPCMRSYSIKLVSKCTSIFNAVLLVKVQIFITQVWVMPQLRKAFGIKYHSTTDILVEVGIGFTVFVAWFMAITLLSRAFQHSHEALFVVEDFIAHECAFVAIHTFGHLQHDIADWYPSCLRTIFRISPVLGGILMWTLGVLTSHLRRGLLVDSRDDAGAGSPGGNTPAAPSGSGDAPGDGSMEPALRLSKQRIEENTYMHQGDYLHWEVCAQEGENDATAILVSFLIRQGIFFFSSGDMPWVQKKHEVVWHEDWDFVRLGICATVIYAITSTVVYARMSLRLERGRVHGQSDVMLRALNFVQLVLCMSAAWVALLLVQWSVQRLLGHPALWNILSAILISPAAVVTILVLLFLGNRGIMTESLEHALIDSHALMVGFAWELAFTVAVDTVTLDIQVHRIFTELVLCSGLMVIILPAWMWYLVPHASVPTPTRKELAKPADAASPTATPHQPS